MDETRGHESMEKTTLKAGTEIQVQGQPVYLANETTVRGDAQNIERLRNAQRQGGDQSSPTQQPTGR